MNVIIDEIAKRAFEICDKLGITHPSHREMFVGGYREGLKANPWHKTSEELPPHFGDYLVVIKSQQFGRRCAFKCWYGYPEDPFGDNTSKEWVLEDDEIVTHWMEIPELPKED